MFFHIMKTLLRICFRVEVKGIENYALAGDRVLIVINPGSLLDALLIAIFLPERTTLAIDKNLAKKWWMRPILNLGNTLQLDFSQPTSTRNLIKAIEQHQHCMVFHAARFSNDPAFMKILEATSIIAEKAKATLLPILISGAQFSMFSYYRHKAKLHWFPKIILTILPPQSLKASMHLPPRERRQATAVHLYRVVTELLYRSARVDQNVLQAFCDAVAIFGRKYVIAEDQDRNTLAYGPMLTKVQALGRTLGRTLKDEGRVGFLMPNSLAAVVAFLACHIRGKVPAMLNFTAGTGSVLSACSTVQLRSVITARKFIQVAELGALEQAMKNAGLRIIYLEDVAAGMPLRDKLLGAWASFWRKAPKTPADEPVAILFTSGSEGMPKAVFMSHRNANSNREQLLSVVTVHSGDRMFNCLPMFHTFGLGVGTLLPLASGIRMFLYPSPLHYRLVPQMFYESLSTIICGTDTFFAGYARYGQPYDFFNARYVIAGAEKLRPTTAETWKKFYGVRILEGYGATETSPVIAVNTPANIKDGSVGRILPGLQYKLKPVPGVATGGLLCVKGANVMMGYMRSTSPGVLEPPCDLEDANPEGWYDTGDIVDTNTQDFITIKGRAKRFAKVGGEMISLAAVEEALHDLFPEARFGVVAVPDDRKGEQLVLVVEREITAGQIATHFAGKGYPSLWVPKRTVWVKQAPLLGTGKFDYATALQLVLAKK